jgi:hypothetical protein
MLILKEVEKLIRYFTGSFRTTPKLNFGSLVFSNDPAVRKLSSEFDWDEVANVSPTNPDQDPDHINCGDIASLKSRISVEYSLEQDLPTDTLTSEIYGPGNYISATSTVSITLT